MTVSVVHPVKNFICYHTVFRYWLGKLMDYIVVSTWVRKPSWEQTQTFFSLENIEKRVGFEELWLI